MMFSVSLVPSALSAQFIGKLRNKEATEGATATLRCELSKAALVEWRKGTEPLTDGDRLSLKQEGAVCELQIQGLVEEDGGEYSCVCGQERTSATLTVRGKDHVCPQALAAVCLKTVSGSLCAVSAVSSTAVCSQASLTLALWGLLRPRAAESGLFPAPWVTAWDGECG